MSIDPPTRPPDPSRLVTEIADLIAEVREMRETAKRIEPDIEAERRRGRLTRLALAAVAVLAVGAVPIGWTAWQAGVHAGEASQRVEAVVQRSLCPIFALFIGAYNPESRPEGEARDRYNEQFAQFRVAYGELHCRTPIVPPPISR